MHFPPYVAKVIDEQSNEEKWLHEFSSFLHAPEAPLGQGEEDWALATLKMPIESWKTIERNCLELCLLIEHYNVPQQQSHHRVLSQRSGVVLGKTQRG